MGSTPEFEHVSHQVLGTTNETNKKQTRPVDHLKVSEDPGRRRGTSQGPYFLTRRAH
jgi:hypothetical protein